MFLCYNSDVAHILQDKIRVGVSACNAGARVRWNRAGWDRLALLGREKSSFIWTPVCPEVMAGLGVPRHPIRLVSGNGEDFWQQTARVKNKPGEDVSAMVRDGALSCLEALKRAGVEAFVFMEGSPSCGVYRTTLKNRRLGKPPGVFGSLLIREDFFLIPALDLESPLKRWDWRRRLHAFCWLKRERIESKDQIYHIWHDFKFLCQEVDDPEARRIGAELADLPRRLEEEMIEAWRSSVLRLLRRPSTLKRVNAVMQKHYAYYRKHLQGGDLAAPEPGLSKHRYVEELVEMEKRAFKEQFSFAGTPVLFRERPAARPGDGDST
jgi:uncharacterized protein YbbK (DUF523 family)